ncbi:flavin reductase family protein [Streptomyces sp. NBC_01497]|uniref:flavin reductase family protein n=1 Tax=Streptomyces sp. NBC_01497 TaxID=2903885 RepID=UPI002E34066C|nr:flavin reductase family protein [Streptomyces sp. NBC_01497]
MKPSPQDPGPARIDGPPVAGALLRRVAAHHPTGVVLVTGPPPAPHQLPPAMVMGTFTSVSLDPALIGLLPAKSSTTWPRIRTAGRFCVNVLAADQEELCRNFAAADPGRWKVPYRRGAGGSPVLLEALAWFDCELAGEVDAGDHWFVTGAVRDLGVQRGDPPLVFFQGRYSHCRPPADSPVPQRGTGATSA